MNDIPLSPVDYIFTGPGSQPVTMAFYYPVPLDPGCLKTGLEQALVHFPVVRSKLHPVSENEYVFRLSDDGLIFDASGSHREFRNTDRIREYIEPVISREGHPLTRIRLTRTPGGTVLGVSISHALVDGFSYFHFLSSWARLCRGERILEPALEREAFASMLAGEQETATPDAFLADCGLFYESIHRGAEANQIRTERFFVSDESIHSLLEEIKQEAEGSFTQNDALTAWLWKKYLPLWIHREGNPVTYLTCPFDFRRVVPGFPKTYFGCALGFATAAIDLNGLHGAPLGNLALRVRQAVGAMKKDRIMKAMSTLNHLRLQKGLAALEAVHLRHPAHGMIVTNLTRMPVRDLNFGSGVPSDFVIYAEVANSAALLPAENGVEIVAVPPQE